jgi:hypothetical protein
MDLLSSSSSDSSNSAVTGTDWKDLYMLALFERDKTKLAERIAAAQAEIKTRRRKLSKANGVGNDHVTDRNERQTLDNALFSLQALASCLLMSPREGKKTKAVSAGRAA